MQGALTIVRPITSHAMGVAARRAEKATTSLQEADERAAESRPG